MNKYCQLSPRKAKETIWQDFLVKPRTNNCNCLFARRVRRSHVHVTEVAQHGFVFFAHAACEIWIAQMLVARRLRHVLQHAQALPDGSLPVGRHLLPLRKHFILDVTLLLWRELPPGASVVSNLLLFLGRQPIEPFVVLL